MTTLEARQIVKRFGGLVAVDHMDLTVESGRITALIGPNGAGKTTIFNCLTGLLPMDEGEVHLDGRRLNALDIHERARAGLGRTFQRLEVFTGMTVRENLQVAAEVAIPGSVFLGLFRVRHETDPRVAERVDEVLTLTGLGEFADEVAGDLSTGILRRVELARALCTGPTILLLDEPASGLDTSETEEVEGVLRTIAGSGVGILLVEHDVELVMDVSDHVYVMDFGEPLADGPPEVVADDPKVKAAYLGVDQDTGPGTVDDTQEIAL